MGNLNDGTALNVWAIILSIITMLIIFYLWVKSFKEIIRNESNFESLP
jgi:hypothetical protein